MNRQQLNSQQMGEATSQNLANNQSLITGKPEVVAAAALHTINMSNISNIAVQQLNAQEISGLIRDKNLLRTLMIFNATRIIDAITAFGNKTGNDQLVKSVAFTPSKMKSVSDNSALAMFQKVSEVANENIDAIEPFGATPEMVTLLDEDIISFTSIIKKPKQMHSDQRMITENLAAAFKTMKTHLKTQLDRLIRSFFLGTNFEKSYFLARKIYDIGTPATIFRGKVTDENGHPVRNCMVELINYPSPGINSTRITNIRGEFAYKKLTATNVTARFRAVKFVVSEFDILLNKDHETIFNTTLIIAPVPVTIPA
jgi:hypothetical protein